MRRATMSTREQRQALVSGMEKASEGKGEVFRKRIPFANDDVPRFLEKLSEFEKESQKVRIVSR